MVRLRDAVTNHFIDKYGGNFTAEEFMGGRENLQKEIIIELTQFRNWFGYPIEITSAYRDDDSSHGTGLSIDFIIWRKWQTTQPDILTCWNALTRWPFTGIGIYFDWERGVGFHADVIRKVRQRPLRWLRLDGEYYYQSVFDNSFYNGNMKTTVQSEIKKYYEQNS